MSAGGLCQICQDAEADDRCDRCGTLVCAEHFRAEYGVCLDCAAELGVGRGPEGVRDGSDDHPDVDRYQF